MRTQSTKSKALATLSRALPALWLKGDALATLLNEWALLGLCVERTSDVQECFVTVFVMPLFVHNEIPIDLSIGQRLRSRIRDSDRWNASSAAQMNELIVIAERAISSEVETNRELHSYLCGNASLFSNSDNLNLMEIALLSLVLLGDHSREIANIRSRITEHTDQHASWQVELNARVETYLARPRTDVVSELGARRKRFLENFYPSLAGQVFHCHIEKN